MVSNRAKLRDPDWFIPRMVIRDAAGKLCRLKPRAEQLEVIEALNNYNKVLILKSRQLGITTVVVAWFLHHALVSKNQYSTLQMGHEGDAVTRLNQMTRVYLNGLPPVMRPRREPDSSVAIGLTHNDSLFKQSMAGGRSQGKSYTFQALHVTEMGSWPTGSSASGGKGTRVDERAWGSINATLHETPDTRICIESTAEGPSGVFHRLCGVAQQSDEWKFLFFPWFDFQTYRRKVPTDWERTDEEEDLAMLFGLDDAQLVFRRSKVEDTGLREFRKDYPSTPEEPFLLSEGMWFDVEFLNIMLAGLPANRMNEQQGLHIYVRPEFGRQYFIGVDTSGGVGADEAVIQVLRDDGEQVARYASIWTGPADLALEAKNLSGLYTAGRKRARVLCERNKYGVAFIKRAQELGCRLWKDDKGKDWWTDPSTKAKLYDYGRSVVNNGHTIINDPGTIQQMVRVREQSNGNIMADEGYKDDRSMAYMLALWNARSARRHNPDKSRRDMIAEQRRRRVERGF